MQDESYCITRFPWKFSGILLAREAELVWPVLVPHTRFRFDLLTSVSPWKVLESKEIDSRVAVSAAMCDNIRLIIRCDLSSQYSKIRM